MTDRERAGATDPDRETLVLELDRPSPTPIELTVRPAAAPDAPMYVLVPAMGMPAGFYTPLLVALAASGVGAAVIELRGHQRRAAPPPGRGHDYGYRDLAGDLAAAVTAVRELRPQAPVLTLGHSLGGQVAAAQAALWSAGGPAAPDRMALVASGSVGWSTWDGGSYRHLVRTQAALGLTKLVGHFPGDRVGFAGREAPTQMTEWGRWARTGRFVIGDPPVDVADAAPAFERPILALTFDGDPLSPPGSSDALVAMFTRAPVTREHRRLDVRRPHFDWVRQPGPVLGRLLEWARAASRVAENGS